MVVNVNKKTTFSNLAVYYGSMNSESNRNIPDSMYAEIGQKVVAFRKEVGLSQSELAHKLDVSQQIIAAYEAGTRRIPLQTFIRITEILHVSLYDLIPVQKSDKKPGPTPKIIHGFERLKSLPKKKQAIVLDLIESLSEN